MNAFVHDHLGAQDVPPPPTSHSTAYQEAAKTLTETLNASRDPCDSFYEYACERSVVDCIVRQNQFRYGGTDMVVADAQNNVYNAVYKALNSSRGNVTLAVVM